MRSACLFIASAASAILAVLSLASLAFVGDWRAVVVMSVCGVLSVAFMDASFKS